MDKYCTFQWPSDNLIIQLECTPGMNPGRSVLVVYISKVWYAEKHD